MLERFESRRIGFSQSLKTGDFFEYEEEDWIIRAISNVNIKERIVKGFNGRYGRQSDMIVAEIIAQKIDDRTVPITKRKETEEEFVFRFDPLKTNSMIKLGEFFISAEGNYYVAIEIEDVKFEFVSVKMTVVGKKITELSGKELKNLNVANKINQLGWQIISK